MNWKQLWAKAKSALFAESNWDRADRIVRERLKAMRAKEAKEVSKDEYKSGLADPVTLAVVAIVCGLLGGVFSSGVNTRSIVHRSQITVKDSPGAVVFVDFGSNTVEVSGSGGVSIPVTGGK